MSTNNAGVAKYGKQLKLLLLLAFIHQLTFAQVGPTPNADTIQKKMDYYSALQSPAALFIHFDKNIYTNNENVWFTAYLVNCKDLAQHQVLSVALIKDDDHKIALQGLFTMGHGIGFGNFFLPDTIAPGNYNFVASTNRVTNGVPDVSFTQPITIKTISGQNFNASLDLTDTSQNKKVLLTVRDKRSMAVPGANVEYQFTGEKNNPALKQKTDIAGQSQINVPPGTRIIEAKVTVNKDVKRLKLLLPASQAQLKVKFYPEGGNLVDNLASVVGLEVRNTAGQPIQCNAVICSNDVPFDTVSTNIFGLCKFKLRPQSGVKFYVKINYGNEVNTFTLPDALPAGATLAAENALANDTLKIMVRSRQPGTYFLLVHNYKQLFSVTPLKMSAFSPVLVKVDLALMPRGMAEVTLTDSSQRPLAERLFFAKFDQKPILGLNTDKADYATRQKVTVKLKLNPVKTKQVKGLVSIACVQANRIDPAKFSNIESYLYFKNELDITDAENYQLAIGKDNKQNLEDVLLIKGWRRYTWPDLMRRNALDTVVKSQTLLFNGDVTYFGKPLKKPMIIGMLHDSATKLMNTSEGGRFVLENANLITGENKKVMFFASDNNDYTINIHNPYTKLNTQLAKQIKDEDNAFNITAQNTETFVLKGSDHVTQLKEVKIKGSSDLGDTYYGPNIYVSKTCTDYVCMYNILNCPNHPFGSPPVEGGTYNYKGRVITYHGCGYKETNNMIVNVDGIWTSKEYYAADYAKFNPPDAEYLSAIYWKHLIDLNSAKETEISFYTSDITGDFKIIVQGVTDDDVIYSSKSFMVKKP